jgi:transposase
MKKHTRMSTGLTIGLDLGDDTSVLHVLDVEGETVERGKVRTREPALRRRLGSMPPSRVVIETGTHSPWVSRVLADLGHEVIVANARRVEMISKSTQKTDDDDAETLARLGRVDPRLLSPIHHRGRQAQIDLATLRSRDAVVGCRSKLIACVRGQVKSLGLRLPGCSAECFHRKAREDAPEELREALEPLFEQIGQLTQQIRGYDRRIEELCEERYPETKVLRQIKGVGPITALAFVLTIEDPTRFRRRRSIGAYLGLRPRRRQSGNSDPQLRITKEGDPMLRRLLVSCARYILGPFGDDSDLRRFGMKLVGRGGKAARSKAAIAVARKLAVLLLSLMITSERYEPLRNANIASEAA